MERNFTEQELVRIEKIAKIKDICNPYPDKYEKTHSLKDACLLEDGTKEVRLAGRIEILKVVCN